MKASTQPDAALQNNISGQEVAKQNEALGHFDEQIPERKRALSRTHAGYWKDRLEKRCYTRDGELHEVNEWSVRIQHLGKRQSFALRSSNAETAAIKARDLYMTVVSKGWAAAEAEYNPAMIIRKDDPTLGEFLGEVELKSGLKPKTFRGYSVFFRRIVSDIFGLDGGKAKFSHRVASISPG